MTKLTQFFSVVIFLFSFSIQAQTSQYPKTDIKDLLDVNGDRLAITYTYFSQKHIFIDGLEEDLFQRYKIQDSRGPAWKNRAIEVLEGEHDFHEAASYWGERTEYQDLVNCGLVDNVEKAEEIYNDIYNKYEIKNWKSVKLKSGSDKTLLYIVGFYTTLYAQGVTCDFLEDEYVFLNSSESTTAPVYLGILGDRPYFSF